MALKEVWGALQSVIDNETKTNFGDFSFEFCNLTVNASQFLDMTSAVFSIDLISNDANNNSELSFTRFLGTDFVKKPFLLVSKERSPSVADINQNQSTPRSNKSNGIISPQEKPIRIESHKSNGSDDVWGSPLKCNIPAEDESISMLSLDSSQMCLQAKKRKPKRMGIALNWARKMVSAFNINNRPNPSCVPSVLVLCDGGDGHRTALVGVTMFPVPRPSGTAKGLKTVTVTVDEKGSMNEWNSRVKMGGDLSQSCQAVYQVSTGPMDRDKPWGTVAVEIKWKGASRLLEMPPTEASTVVKASVQSGSLQSSMDTYYQELQFLTRIISALTTGEVEWVSPGSDKPTASLTTSIRSLIETLQEEGTLGSAVSVTKEGEGEAWTFATALKNFSVAERKDYDFTDRLWKVMVNCMSTADLVSSLRLVFAALGKGQLRPFVDRHNQTTVAQMVRETFTGRFSAPSLTGVQPYLFLAEMGAEKLRRDYIHLFVSQCLATPSALESLTATDRDLQAKLTALEKLHSVLEMVTLLEASLRLPTDTLGVIAQQMLSHYHQHPVKPRHVFSFSVKTSEVRYVLGAVRPIMWCVETSSKVLACDSVYQSSLHCLSTSQPFLHLLAAPRRGLGDKGDDSENMDNRMELSSLGDSQGQYCLVQRKETVIIM